MSFESTAVHCKIHKYRQNYSNKFVATSNLTLFNDIVLWLTSNTLSSRGLLSRYRPSIHRRPHSALRCRSSLTDLCGACLHSLESSRSSCRYCWSRCLLGCLPARAWSHLCHLSWIEEATLGLRHGWNEVARPAWLEHLAHLLTLLET